MDTVLRGTKLPSPRFRIAPFPEELRHVRGFSSLQTFFPTLTKLYRISKHQTAGVWLDSKMRIQSIDISGTSGSCKLTLVPNMDVLAAGTGGEGATVAAAGGTPIPAFLKVTHLLDPVRWMKGLYSIPKHSGLPWHNKTWQTASTKLQDPWNQAYVETMASYALGRLREEGVSPHFNHFYGAFCARADIYRYNLTDEFSTYRNARWFWHGQKKGLFKLCVVDPENPKRAIDSHTLAALMEEPSEQSSEGTGSETESEIDIDMGSLTIASNAAPGSIHSADSMSDIDFEEESGQSDSEEGDTEDDSSEAEELRIYSEFNDFPVMLIAIEENQGTMDSLLDNFTEVGAVAGTPEWEERWSAWLFQVVAALSVAQDVLGLTHNDLHTNNVVWIPTEEEYLYYTNRAGSTFRVPTFGKLFRVIDFGRSIFRINQTLFISDDFRTGNDADGQYCFKPLHPRPAAGEEVHPNPSFDLCRLAVSLFDSIFPEAPAAVEGERFLSKEKGLDVRETVSPLYNAIWSWMVDDEGKNVLIDADGEERFPDFELYRHIAARVHTAIPAQQFSKPVFDRFQVPPSSVPTDVKRWSLFA